MAIYTNLRFSSLTLSYSFIYTNKKINNNLDSYINIFTIIFNLLYIYKVKTRIKISAKIIKIKDIYFY